MRNPEERVKVVLAESGTSVGGTERVVWELATRLPASRFEVEVWLSPAAGVDELAASLEARGCEVRRVPEVDSRWDGSAMFRTWRQLRRSAPGLLHIHHVWPAADRYLAPIAEAAGVPHVVITEHIVGESHSPAQRRLKHRELDRADVVTAVSEAVAESLVRDYAIDRARIRIVPNGAEPPDEEQEKPAARRVRESLGAGVVRPLWVCAGRLEAQKGQDVLLEALGELRTKGLEFVCALAGEGSQRSVLERRIETLGLGGVVRLLGQVDEIGPLLAAADVVVLPSRWEGLPLVLLEAMARGRAIVATAVGGIPEAIEDDVHGRLVPPDDPAALARALASLHQRPDTSYRLGMRAADRARERYNWGRVVETFEAVYDEVLGLASFSSRRGHPAREAVR
jgi:glycosyltransferase involved in cell wall biosynthesis